MFELTLWQLQKFKTSHLLSSRILILEKWRLGAANQNGSTENFGTKFFGYLTNYVALEFFDLADSVFCHTNRTWTKNTLFLGWDELGSLGLRGLSPTLDLTSHQNLGPSANKRTFFFFPLHPPKTFKLNKFCRSTRCIFFEKNQFSTIPSAVFLAFYSSHCTPDSRTSARLCSSGNISKRMT